MSKTRNIYDALYALYKLDNPEKTDFKDFDECYEYEKGEFEKKLLLQIVNYACDLKLNRVSNAFVFACHKYFLPVFNHLDKLWDFQAKFCAYIIKDNYVAEIPKAFKEFCQEYLPTHNN